MRPLGGLALRLAAMRATLNADQESFVPGSPALPGPAPGRCGSVFAGSSAASVLCRVANTSRHWSITCAHTAHM